MQAPGRVAARPAYSYAEYQGEEEVILAPLSLLRTQRGREGVRKTRSSFARVKLRSGNKSNTTVCLTPRLPGL